MAQSIGFFQFDNLVQGRVPFLFVNIGVETSAVYPHVFKMHLERMQMPVPEGSLAAMSIDEVVAQIKTQKKNPEDAIVILCENGDKSLLIAEALEEAHYLNVFLVAGGWKRFLSERSGL